MACLQFLEKVVKQRPVNARLINDSTSHCLIKIKNTHPSSYFISLCNLISAPIPLFLPLHSSLILSSSSLCYQFRQLVKHCLIRVFTVKHTHEHTDTHTHFFTKAKEAWERANNGQWSLWSEIEWEQPVRSVCAYASVCVCVRMCVSVCLRVHEQ